MSVCFATLVKPQHSCLIVPVWDFPHTEQIIGRLIRYGSHANLPVNQLKS